MGKIKQGILGGFKGKVGTAIGSSWNGIAYMKGLPQSVKNPRTDAQVQQREFFRQVQSLVTQLSDEQLASLFPNVTRGMTRRNMLTRQLSACHDFGSDNKVFDLALLEGIGNGERINSPMLSAMVSLPTNPDAVPSIMVAPADLAAIGKPAEACFAVVAYNLTRSRIGIFQTEQCQSDTELDIPVGNFGEVGDAVRYYLTYSMPDRYGHMVIVTRPERDKEKK